MDNCLNGQSQTCDPMEGATEEECDLLDNDCDGQTDEELGITTCGLGECEHTVDNCVGGQWQICDPFEGATSELCDGLDNDCNGETDDLDEDEDGYLACFDDCDDADASVNPGVDEVQCDGIDNDCDPGSLDNPDQDGDDWTVCDGDCDDSDPEINPGMSEVPCNGKDDDCDPTTLDGVCPLFEQAVCVDELLVMRNNSMVGSYEMERLNIDEYGEARSRGDMFMYNNATVAGRVVVWGNLGMRNHALITGDALVGGSVTMQNHAWIAGDHISLEQQPPPCDGGYDLAGNLAWVSVYNDNQKLWSDQDIAQYLTPDGGLSVGSKRSVILPSGTFYFTYLELNNKAALFIEEGATVAIFVEEWINFRNGSSLNNDPDQADQLNIFCGAMADAGEEVTIRNNTDLGMYLFAPGADIELDNNATIQGGIVCRRLTLRNNTEVLQPVEGVSR